MHTSTRFGFASLVLVTLAALFSEGCSDASIAVAPGPGAGGVGASGGIGGSGGSGASGGAGFVGGGEVGGSGGDAVTTSGTGGGMLPPPTEKVYCSNKLYQCGDLIDNDSDGLIDYQDPDCLGPCDNTEDSFYPNLPGGSGQNCDLDCFWDTGQGHEENCYWDHRCDPHADLANHPVANPQEGCSWNSDTKGPVGGKKFPPSPYTCDEMYNQQPQDCLDACHPLTPNGCDCFGCCELGGQYVWIGSVAGSSNNGTCTIDAVGAPDFLDKCHPCVPVPSCNNPCETCELCIGKTTLPPECYPGEGGGGGAPQQCPPGQQACGLPNQPACPSGQYCITGCCVVVPS